jgi:hypothetical protein
MQHRFKPAPIVPRRLLSDPRPLASLVVLILLGLGEVPSWAACDNVPTAIDEFRAAQGAITSPFAQPGDVVQVRVRPTICDSDSSGLHLDPTDPTSACRSADAVRVSVVFTPGDGAAVNAAVLARNCSGEQAQVDAWATQLAAAGGTAVCFDESSGAEAPGLEIVRLDLGQGVGECRLNLRFPTVFGTSAPSPDTVLAGPAKIAVDLSGTPLPTGISEARCADTASTDGRVACVDELYETDGTCFTEAAHQHRRFPSFTALPPANDFAAMCTAPPGDSDSPCLGTQPAVRFALDASGNVLAPVDWSGVLFEGAFDDFPPPQLVSFFSNVGSGLPNPPGDSIAVPEQGFLSSHTTRGKELPPIFDPLADATLALSLFGSADAPLTVIRVQSRSGLECHTTQGGATGVACLTDLACGAGEACGASVCEDAPGISCTGDAQCPGGCGPALFDLSYLRVPAATESGLANVLPTPGPGPAILPAGSYGAGTDGFVPLDALSLCRSSDAGLSCILRDEVLAGQAQNGDSDVLDPAVVTLRDKRTGAQLPVGFGGSLGLATTLIHEPTSAIGPFAGPIAGPNVRPAASGAEECVALLLAEPWENAPDPIGTDASGDGAAFGSALRVFCRQPDGSVAEVAQHAAGAPPFLAASAAPRILQAPFTRSPIQGGGEPIVIADDGNLIYFLLDESAATPRSDRRIDVDSTGIPGDAPASEPVVSADGQVVCFSSEAGDLVGSRDKNRGGPDVFCHDLASGVTDVANRFQEPPSKRPLCEGRIIRANAPAFAPDLAASGGRVCYESAASNLSKGDKNKQRDVFVHDRESCETFLVSETESGDGADAASWGCSLSRAGDWVGFVSRASLVASDSDALADAYLRNIDDGTLLLASAGLEGEVESLDLAAGAGVLALGLTTPAGANVVLLERSGLLFEIGISIPGARPRLDPDATQLSVETGPGPETLLVDLVNGFIEPLAVDATLRDLGADSFDASLAAVSAAFVSTEALTPGDPAAGGDVYVRDLTTRFLKRVGVGAGEPDLAGDGTTLVYAAPASGGRGIFLDGADPGVAPADFDGNGRTGERVLAALDLSGAPTIEILGAASEVAVDRRTVAYLEPGPPVQARVRELGCGGTCPESDTNLGPASAVATSQALTCVLRGADDRLACAPPGLPLVDQVDENAAPLPAEALAVVGNLVIFTAVDPSGARRLRIHQPFGAQGPAVHHVGQPGTRRFVTSDNGFVAYDRCEMDAGEDLNDDGLEDECVLILVDGASGETFEPGFSVLPCTLEACDRRFPWRIFGSGAEQESATARFLTLECQECGSCGDAPRVVEPCCDLDQNGSCEDIVIQEFDFLDRQLVLANLSSGTSSDPLAGAESGQGGLDAGAVFPAVLGRCESDAGLACQIDANCPSASDRCVDLVPAVLALADSDGDGLFDGFDNCQFTFNPDQGDGDADSAGDACDLFSCGDGIVDSVEYCDDGSANGSAQSFCTSLCTPVVLIEVSEASVNPGQKGILPGALLGTPVLNLDDSAQGDRPAAMVDAGTLRFEGVAPGESCSGDGGAVTHDLAEASLYAKHLKNANGDGIPDLSLHIDVPTVPLAAGDTEICVSGAFREIEGRFRPASFEARAPLNLN